MQISDQIIAVLDDLCQRFGVVIDWTAENVLPYMTELLGKVVAYELWTSVAWLLLTLIPPIVLYKSITKYRAYSLKVKESYKHQSDFEEVIFITGIVIGCAGTVIGCLMGISQVFDIVTCLTFPEKVIYDFISQMSIS